jgi:hypothetical protein
MSTRRRGRGRRLCHALRELWVMAAGSCSRVARRLARRRGPSISQPMRGAHPWSAVCGAAVLANERAAVGLAIVLRPTMKGKGMRTGRGRAILPWTLGVALAAFGLGSACGDSSDNRSTPDSGLQDADPRFDARPDAMAPDAGAQDAAVRDAGSPDAGSQDAAALDAGAPDANSQDAAVRDAGAPDFVFAAEPPFGIVPGASGDAAVKVTRTGGQFAPIQVTIETNALGIAGSGTVSTGASSGTLTITVPASVAFGTYSLSANATDGTHTRSVSFSLTVTPSTIRGTAAGSGFLARDAVSATGVSNDSCPMNGLIVSVSNALGICSRAADACLGKSDLLEINLAAVDAKAIGPGTYEVIAPDPRQPPPLGKFVVQLSQKDSSCQSTSPENLPRASPGSSATITAASDTAVSGSIDLVFSDGGRVSGSFAAPRCSALAPRNGFCAQPTPPICSGTRTCQ